MTVKSLLGRMVTTRSGRTPPRQVMATSLRVRGVQKQGGARSCAEAEQAEGGGAEDQEEAKAGEDEAMKWSDK